MTARALLSSSTTAEPLLWCTFWTITVYLTAQRLDHIFSRHMPSLLAGWILAPLVLRLPNQSPPSALWRSPSSDKTASDPAGVCMSLALVPLVCLGLAQTTLNRRHDEWTHQFIHVLHLTMYGWFIKRRPATPWKRRLLAIICILYFTAMIIDDAPVLLFSWLFLYHSMGTLLPVSFHGVFTQGEWMLVASVMSLAVRRYLFYESFTSTPGTIAMAGLLSVLLAFPLLVLLQKIPVPFASKHQSNPISHEVWKLLLQLPFWVGLPLLGVEGMEFYWLRPYQTVEVPDILEVLSLSHEYIPKSILWLAAFLLETEPMSVTSLLPGIPRYGWLVYWLLILAVTIPFAPTPQHEQEQEPSEDGNQLSNTQHVVLMRKWFHGIAVLLFTPVTFAAPQLLSLSYAIALAILILLEGARKAFPALIAPFHQRYLDPTKDSDERLVISHMALIVGCALPLWISELIPTATPLILPLWGVLSLGVGDAMGAIVGVLCGKTQWSPDNSRTLEGSLAMWASLMASCWALQLYTGESLVFWPTVTFVTLLEAHTFQIDNLVLPLAGAASILWTMGL